MNTYVKSLSAILLLFIATLLAACGSGGSSSTGTAATVATPASTLITGTAAAGAPVVGFVSVRDASANAQPVLTNIEIKADGKYTVDVKGLTPPFAFLATGEVGGKRIELYSAATQADVGGTINITPFTDLIVRNVAGTVANQLVDDFLKSGKLANLTAAQVETERVSLTAKLSPVMQAAGLATSIDLMRASFNADGTGLDRFMDLVKVDTTVPTAVTITNILDDANKLTVNPTGTKTTETLSATGVTDGKTPTALTASDLIRQTFKTFSDSFATQMPKSDDPAITALFADTFMDDGESTGAMLSDITGNKELIGMKFGGNGLVIDSIDAVNGTARVSFVPVSATGEHLASDARSGVIQWQMKRVGTAWLIDGNQRIANVRVRAAAGRNVCGSNIIIGCVSKSATGLTLDIFNHGLRAIGSAVVKGPGLPDAGVTLVARTNDSQFWLQSNVPTSVNTGVNFVNPSLYEMDDVTIGNLGANGTYTVALFDTATPAVLLATYTEVVTAAPVLNTALATLAFPELGARISLTNFAGGTLTPTWTIPTGLKGDTASAFVYLQSASAAGVPSENLENQSVQFNLSGKAATGTANMVFTAPNSGGVWTGGSYWIQAWDANDRKVFTNYLQ